MGQSISKASLTPARRRLLELLQQVYFGRVENLIIREGQPVFDPLPRVVLERKLPGENKSRDAWITADFALKAQLVELFVFFDEMRDGTIELLEIKHGLPFRLFVAGNAA
jgi:hypothetical protein